ncbi:hypothetical protein [Microbacterium enclense]|uniref:hypothetical protein n=1 Tax=Microbacterium enclense TaxID=993073 RepID=UPI003F8051ED
MTWSLERVANPDEDQRDAYERITVAMDQAVARWNKLANTWRHLTVRYDTNVETAEAWGSSGLITFGGNRQGGPGEPVAVSMPVRCGCHRVVAGARGRRRRRPLARMTA